MASEKPMQIDMESGIRDLIHMQLLREEGGKVGFTIAGAEALLILSQVAKDITEADGPDALERALKGEG